MAIGGLQHVAYVPVMQVRVGGPPSIETVKRANPAVHAMSALTSDAMIS